MNPWRATTVVGAALATASLALTVDNLRRLRVPPRGPLPPGTAAARVVVLLPVRDEVDVVEGCLAAIGAAVRAWPGEARVVVLDDQSSDGTTAVLARLAAGASYPLEVVAGADPPSGWLGKPWACAQLAEAAGDLGDGGVLVFVDADVTLAADALVATVALLRAAGLDLVCPYPRQVARSAGERLVQPLLQWSWASTLPLGLAEHSPRPSLAVANGQLLAVDAAAYHRAGGHAAVRGDVLEDLALVRAVKRAGGRGGVADGTRIATCRMYDGWAEVRAGYAKSLWAGFGSAGGVLLLALLALAHVVAPAAALRGSRAGLLAYAAGVCSRVLVGRRTGTRVLPDAAAHPLSVLLLAGLTVDSVVGRARGRLSWKGRPVGTA